MRGLRGMRPAFTLALVLFAAAARAQTGNLIQREIEAAIEKSFWRAGPFRLTPVLRIGGSYDTNALSSSVLPQSDVSFLAGPGLRAALPFGRRALLDLYEEVDFVYFRDLTVLSDVFDVTRIGGAFGGRSLLFQITDEFRDEKTRPSSEFDIPVDQRTNRLGASLSLALGRRNELELAWEQNRVQIGDPTAMARVSDRLDRTNDAYRLGLTRYLTGRTSLLFEGFHERTNFIQDLPQGKPLSYGVRGGVTFSPKGNARGQAVLGFRSVTPSPGQPGFKGLIGEVNTQFRFGARWGVGALFARDVEPSILDDNWYFVENRYGGSVLLNLGRVSLRPEVQFGRNTYPRPSRFTNAAGGVVVQPITDRFGSYAFTLGYRVSASWAVTTTATYSVRDSDLPVFQKDRFFVTFGLSRDF